MAAKSLAQRVEFPTHQERDLTAQLDARVKQFDPALRAAYGVGPDVAAQLLVTAGTNPHRLLNEAAFAALCGAAPFRHPRTNHRHRLSRGGDRATNSALTESPWYACRAIPHTRGYVERQGTKGRTKKRSCDSSSEPSHVRSFDSSPRLVRSTTTPTCGRPGRPRHHPRRRRPPFRVRIITVSRLDADTNATTTSPPATANGLPLLDL